MLRSLVGSEMCIRDREIYRQSLVRRPVFSLVRLLVRSWPYGVAPAAGKSFWRPTMPHPMLAMPSHAISCTPTPPWSSSKCRNTPSTNQLHVFAFQVGRSVWLHKNYCLNTSSPCKNFRQGGNAWNLFDFDNQSAAIFLCGYHKILFRSKRSKRYRGS